jgi:hypothetical protein
MQASDLQTCFIFRTITAPKNHVQTVGPGNGRAKASDYVSKKANNEDEKGEGRNAD